MQRLNLTSTDARTRIKGEINTRYRELATSLGLAKLRRSTASQNTVSGNNALTYTSVADVLAIYDAVNLQRELIEASVNDIRSWDPDASVTGHVTHYAITNHGATSVTLLLYPKPSSVYALTADVLALGTELSADGDTPAFPEDFHDVLVYGVLFDELCKMEKLLPHAKEQQREFERRKSELRYYLARRAYLTRKPTDRYLQYGLYPRVWPYGV